MAGGNPMVLWTPMSGYVVITIMGLMFRAFYLFLIILLVPPSSQAASVESPESVSKYHRRVRDLSAGAEQVSQIVGIGDDLEALRQLRDIDPSNVEGQLKRLNIRQTMMEDLLTQSFEIRRVIAELDQEMAEADDLRAYLERRRDKAIRLNTIANFLSGGITGIIGGSLDMADVNRYAPISIDTGEGIVQTSIALLALKQQNGERKLMEGMPNKLAKVLDLSPSSDYPENVWKFLNTAAPNHTQTRKQVLVEHWAKSGMIEKAKMRGRKDHLAHLAGNSPKVVISIDLLDARAAMLSDLKACISEMDVYLSELLQILRRARSGSTI